MITSKGSGVILFTFALVTFFSLSVFLTSEALSGQKGKYKGYSKDWKQEKYTTNPGSLDKSYKKNQNKSEKNFSGKNSGKLPRNTEKASDIKRNYEKLPENSEINESQTAE